MDKNRLIIDALAYQKSKSFGFQEYLFNLLDYFYKHRDLMQFKQVMIVCQSSQINDFLIYEDKFDVRGYAVSNIFKRFWVQTIYPFRLGLKKNDIILFTGNFTSYFKKCSYVLVIHDLLYLRKNLLPNRLMKLQRRIFVPRSLRIADKIIAISEFTRQDILNHYKFTDPSKVIRIYNYFNFGKFTDKQQVIDERLIDVPYFLCVASAASHKNVITILRAFEKYCKRKPTINLVVVGAVQDKTPVGDFLKTIDTGVKNRISVRSGISNTEIGNLYKHCEAYITASYFEGLGMPVVEAMYFNSPLILSNLGVFREITGGKGIFFNPDSVEELTSIMINFDKKKCSCQYEILEMFSEQETSQKYIEIFNKQV